MQKTVFIALLTIGLLITHFLVHAEVYKWVDEKGGIHFTDDYSKVPEKYRSQPEREPSSKGSEIISPKSEKERDVKKSNGIKKELQNLPTPIFVIIDKTMPSFTLYFAIPEGVPEKKLEEFKELVAKEKGAEIVTWEKFKQDPHKYITARIIKNEYPEFETEKGMVDLIKTSGLMVPIGLTWNGGVAFTRRDYRHTEEIYQKYKDNPVEYERTRNWDPSRDPVYPGNHFLPLLGNAYTRESPPKPKYAGDYLRQGGLSAQRGLFDDAISYFSKAIEMDPKFLEAYKNRGHIYLSVGKYDLAILDYNKTLEINPSDAWLYHFLGRAHHAKGDYDQAISNYNKAFEMNPNDIVAFNNRGMSYLSMGKYDKAISDFVKATEINPNNPLGYNNLAWLYATAKEPGFRNGKKAVELALKACELSNWKDLRFLDTLAAAYARAGDFNNAVKWQAKALEFPELVKDTEVQQRFKFYKERKPWPTD